MPVIPIDESSVQFYFPTYLGAVTTIFRHGRVIKSKEEIRGWETLASIPQGEFAYSPFIVVFEIPATWVCAETSALSKDQLPNLPSPYELKAKELIDAKWLHPCLVREVWELKGGEFIKIYQRDPA